MVLSQKLHEAFKGTVERITGPRTASAFKEKGVLSVSEFIIAGDNLVAKCPTWSWGFELGEFMFIRDYKPAKFLRFAIDDGTGCIPCILWLNHMTSPHLARRLSPQDLCLLADAASRSASMVKVGVVARVRGKVSGFKGGVQITVTDVFVERDPNAEILHWIECVNLAKNCYNLVNVPSSSSSGSVMRK